MPGLKVIKAALEADGKAWADVLSSGLWRPKARVIKRDGGTTVYRTRLMDRDVVIKCWEMGAKAHVQALFGATRGLRHWQGAARLRKCGAVTAWTWALVRGKFDGGHVECLVMEALHGKTVLQHLSDQDLSVRQQHALARALGRHVVNMMHNALCNRDSKPSNLIAVCEAPGDPAIAVIDCVAIRRCRCADRMLASLVIEPLGVGLRPRRALMMRVIRAWPEVSPIEKDRWRRVRRILWDRVRGLVRDHGDPTPRVNPLEDAT